MSNLSAIGFEASTTEDFQREMAAVFELAAPATDLASYSKRYLWYQDSSGAALAARLGNRGSISPVLTCAKVVTGIYDLDAKVHC